MRVLTVGSRLGAMLRAGLLLLFCLSLPGCEAFFVPLSDPAVAPVAAGATPVLPLRLAVGREAVPLAQDLMAAYARQYPSATLLSLNMSGDAALGALAHTEADAALVAAADEAALRARVPGMEVTVLARVGLAIITHQSTSAAQLTSRALASLFAGNTADWTELDAGQGPPLLAVQSPGSLGRAVFDAAVMNGSRVSTTAAVFADDEGVLQFVAREQGAVGYASTAYLTAALPVNVVAVDLLLPTRANIEKDQYPLAYGIYLVAPQASRAEVRALTAFVQSVRGQAAVRERHALP